MVSRETIADSVEIMLQAHQFDGVVMVASCDKIIPGMLMALLRVDIPGLLISGGPMLCGYLPSGETLDLISVFEGVGRFVKGEIDKTTLKIIEEGACPGAGSCAGMFTANSMNCLAEALGLALPGNGTIPAVTSKRIRLAKYAGMRVVELVKKDIKPTEIATLDAFKNAIAVDMAIGASTNTVLHLPAIAREADIKISLELFDKISRQIPNICKISPASKQHIQDLDTAGGISGVMKELASHNLLNTDLLTVSGMKIRDIVKDAHIFNRDVIRSFEQPYSKEGGIVILKGSLAPDGAVVKKSAVSEKVMRFSGPAIVFNSEESAMDAVMKGKVKKGVVVIRYEGPRGGPGMREMLSITSVISGKGIDEKVALITDGRFSGGTRGLCIGHISPEAASGGPIGLIENGDIIEIDIKNRRLDIKVNNEELKKRKKKQKLYIKKLEGVLLRYSKNVKSANTGAILD